MWCQIQIDKVVLKPITFSANLLNIQAHDQCLSQYNYAKLFTQNRFHIILNCLVDKARITLMRNIFRWSDGETLLSFKNLCFFALFIELNVRQGLHGIFPIGNATVFGSLKFSLTNITIFFHSTSIIYQEVKTFVETFALLKKKPKLFIATDIEESRYTTLNMIDIEWEVLSTNRKVISAREGFIFLLQGN